MFTFYFGLNKPSVAVIRRLYIVEKGLCAVLRDLCGFRFSFPDVAHIRLPAIILPGLGANDNVETLIYRLRYYALSYSMRSRQP